MSQEKKQSYQEEKQSDQNQHFEEIGKVKAFTETDPEIKNSQDLKQQQPTIQPKEIDEIEY